MYTKPMDLQYKLISHMGAAHPDAAKITEMFGVEVELEGTGGICKPTADVHAMWAVHNDGSLRKMGPQDEAIEYVTRVPYNRQDTAKAVKILMDFLNKPGIQVYDSYRTSIHVHVNCLVDTQLHVYNFITLCLLFDELFVSQNGDHRVGNNFCLRAKDAQGQVMGLIQSIEQHGSIMGINVNDRYSSINFASLLKFGTVEFRSLECTTDALRIMHWIRTIDALKQASRKFSDPQDIIRKFSQMSLLDFVYECLGLSAAKYCKVPGYEDMLFSGMRIAQEFAFCSKWIDKVKGKDEEAKFIKAKKPALGNYYQLGNPGPPPIDWAAFQVPAAPQPVHVYEEDAPMFADDGDEDDDDYPEPDPFF